MKEGFLNNNYKLIEENDTNFRLKIVDNNYIVKSEDIQDYADFENRRHEFQALPVECSFCSKDYREHVVSDIRIFSFGSNAIRKNKIIFGEISQEKIFAEISTVSKDFINFFYFEQPIIGRLAYHYGRFEDTDVRQLFNRIISIKVHNLSQPNIQNALKISSTIIENC